MPLHSLACAVAADVGMPGCMATAGTLHDVDAVDDECLLLLAGICSTGSVLDTPAEVGTSAASLLVADHPQPRCLHYLPAAT